MKSNIFICTLIFCLVIIGALILKIVMPFDGIEFNGDSFRYYLSSMNVYKSIQNFSFPEPAFWPYGFPLLVGILFQFIEPTFLHAQFVPIFTAAGLIILLYLILKNNYNFNSKDKIAAFLSLLSFYFCGFILKYQLAIMADLPALFWSGLLVFFLMKFLNQNKLYLLILISLSTSFAIATRYVYGLLIIPILFSFWSTDKSMKIFLKLSFYFLVLTLIFLVPQLILNLKSMDSSFYHPWIQNWNPLYFFVMDRTSVDGHLHVQIPNILFYLLSPFKMSEFNPFGLIIFGFGIFFAFKNKSTVLSQIMIIWYIIFLLFLSGIPIQNPRFALSFYIPIFFFQFEFFRHILETKYMKIILIGSVFLLIIKMVFGIGFLRNTINEKNEMYLSGSNFLKSVKPNSLIITWDFYETYFIYFPNQKVETIHGLTKEKAELLFNQYSEVYLIFDEERLHTAWDKMPPEFMYNWLKQNYSFTLIREDKKYKVWKHSKMTDKIK